MDTNLLSKVTTKFFVGCVLSPDVRIALNHSSAWQQAKITAASDEAELREQHFHGKDYLGIFIHCNQVPLDDLRTKEMAIRSRLHVLCPQLKSHSIPIYVLPITLVT